MLKNFKKVIAIVIHMNQAVQSNCVYSQITHNVHANRRELGNVIGANARYIYGRPNGSKHVNCNTSTRYNTCI